MTTEKKIYDAIIFDLDGTLLDTLEDLTDSVNYTMEQMGYPTHSIDAIRDFVGNGIRTLMIKATPGGEENPAFEQAFITFRDYYLEHNLIKTKAYEGIMPLLEELHHRQIPMAIVSNKNQAAVQDLQEKVFLGLIPVAIGDEEGRARKPAPDGVLEAVKRLHLTEENRILYVGDSEVDAATASGVPMDCALCTWGFRSRELLESLPHVAILNHPLELLELVRGFGER
jgi:phosphoglycolate phosphatase